MNRHYEPRQSVRQLTRNRKQWVILNLADDAKAFMVSAAQSENMNLSEFVGALLHLFLDTGKDKFPDLAAKLEAQERRGGPAFNERADFLFRDKTLRKLSPRATVTPWYDPQGDY